MRSEELAISNEKLGDSATCGGRAIRSSAIASFFASLRTGFARCYYPYRVFKNKFPLASFITSRIMTMLVILFILGWALFGLMSLHRATSLTR
ncbi:hypothetical protein [Treponema sp.]|uniref:hypothetical protein n=1 Tax=Treponema sp. TaxID=166 RepID=UPI00345B72F7